MRRGWELSGSLISLTLLWLLLTGPAGVQLPLSRAEAMYAQIPREMLATGDWLTPRLNGARYLDKPPLLYWVNLLAYKVLGPEAAAARWATALIGLGEILGTIALGTLLWSPAVGWLGGLVLATSLGFFVLHLQILTDHLVSLTLVWAVFFLAWWERRPGLLAACGFHLCAALGLLSKGLIGWAFPWGVAVLYALSRRDRRFGRLLLSPLGLLVFTLVALPWFLLMEHLHPGFLHYHLFNEQIYRFLGRRWPADINPLPLPAFWLFAFLWLLPWTTLLVPTFNLLRRRWSQPGSERLAFMLLLVWAGLVVGFFSFSSSRIEYYLLPALPPLALLLGWRLQAFLTEPPRAAPGWTLWLPVLAVVGAVVSLPLLEQICADNRREFIGMFTQLRPVGQQALPLLAVGFSLAAWLGWRRQPRLWLATFTGTALVLLYFAFQSLRLLSPQLSDAWAGELLQRFGEPEDIIVMGHIEEFEYGMSLRYYSQRRILMVQRQGLPEYGFPLRPGEKYLITPEELQALWQGPRRVIILEDECAPETYLPQPVVLVARHGKRLLTNRPWEAFSELAAAGQPPAKRRQDAAN